MDSTGNRTSLKLVSCPSRKARPTNSPWFELTRGRLGYCVQQPSLLLSSVAFFLRGRIQTLTLYWLSLPARSSQWILNVSRSLRLAHSVRLEDRSYPRRGNADASLRKRCFPLSNLISRNDAGGKGCFLPSPPAPYPSPATFLFDEHAQPSACDFSRHG